MKQKKNYSNKNWEVFINNGKENTGIDVLKWVEIVQKKGVGELLVTSVDQEGTEKGFDYELYKKIKDLVHVPMIANGGCGKIEDILEVSKNDKVDGVALSSVLHFNKIKISEIKNYFIKKNYNIRY